MPASAIVHLPQGDEMLDTAFLVENMGQAFRAQLSGPERSTTVVTLECVDFYNGQPQMMRCSYCPDDAVGMCWCIDNYEQASGITSSTVHHPVCLKHSTMNPGGENNLHVEDINAWDWGEVTNPEAPADGLEDAFVTMINERLHTHFDYWKWMNGEQ